MDTRENSGRSSDEIRQDIERTRAEMHSTVDQLEARLSPGQVLDEIWGRLRQNGGGAGDVVKEHPVPLALMGLGVAWLAVERATRGSGDTHAHGYVGSTDRAEGRVGPYRGDEMDNIRFNDRATGLTSTGDMHADGDGSSGGLKAKAGNIADGAKGAMSGMKDRLGDAKEAFGSATNRIGEMAGDMKEHASHAKEGAGERLGGMREQASHLRGSATERARGAASGIDRVIHDQPLIAGAITFGLGLAAGLAVPSTRMEQQRMGEKADEIKDMARERVSDATDKVKTVASETAGAVKDVAREAMDDPQLKDALVAKVKDVAAQTKSAVAEVAEKQGVDTSRLAGSTNGASGSTSGSGSMGASGSTGGSGSMGASGSSGSSR